MKQRLLSILLAATAVTVAVMAQTTGDWLYHARFSGSGIQSVIDTKDQVYYLANNNLFRYDKSTAENEAINHRNYLSDVCVTDIYYNHDRDYLVVCYDNYNIDVLFDDNRVVNMPELKNASMTSEKTINDVTFADGAIVMATAFGYIRFDDDKFQVASSRNLGVSVASAAIVGERLVLSIGDKLYYGAANRYFETLSSLSSIDLASGKLLPIDGNRVFINNDVLSCVTLGETPSVSKVLDASPSLLQPAQDGFIASIRYADYYYTIDATTLAATRVSASQGMYSCAPAGDGTVWALTADGLHRAADAEGFIKPNSYNIETTPFYLAYNESQGKLYLSATTDNAVLPLADRGALTEVYTYDGSRWQNVTPEGVPANGSGNHRLVFCPNAPNTYFFSTRVGGICRVTDGKVTAVFNSDNSPVRYMRELAFDREGSLWAIDPYGNTASTAPVMVLPRDKVLAATVSATDWVSPTIANIGGRSIKRGALVLGQGGNMVFSPGDFQEAITIWAPDASTHAPRNSARYTELLDQDNQAFQWNYVYCLAADRDGLVWMGSSSGVVSFNPAQAYNRDFRINHIKVPRNDGTGTADYLLDGMDVYCIAVDGSNRKWIGTGGNGLFLVSADGSQVISQFNTSNSYIPGDVIYDVCCNTGSNSVYVMTDKGLAEFISDAGGGGEVQMDELFIYPNPVRPDYNGLVTITGLADNSIVKIADSSGLVIKQLKSSGGTVTWDACGNDGNRVSTGVYFVIASHSDNGGNNNKQAIGKLMIIK